MSQQGFRWNGVGTYTLAADDRVYCWRCGWRLGRAFPPGIEPKPAPADMISEMNASPRREPRNLSEIFW